MPDTIKRTERNKERLIVAVQKWLTKANADLAALEARTALGLQHGQAQVPEAFTNESADCGKLGYYETVAREVMDEAQAPLAELARAVGPTHPSLADLGQQVGELAQEALLRELVLLGRTNQSHLPPERRRTAASYLPMMRRVGHYPLAEDARRRHTRNLERLETLAANAGAHDEALRQEATRRRARIRRQRLVYELGILLFFVAVVAIILIMRKKQMMANLGH